MKRVIDTSVVLKWAIPEEDSAEALLLVGTEIVAPDLLAVELANALCTKVRKGQIEALQATVAYADILSLLTFVPTAILRERALGIALALGHPAYDCFFIALAEAMQTTLITSDLRLLKKCSGTPFESFIEPLTSSR